MVLLDDQAGADRADRPEDVPHDGVAGGGRQHVEVVGREHEDDGDDPADSDGQKNLLAIRFFVVLVSNDQEDCQQDYRHHRQGRLDPCHESQNLHLLVLGFKGQHVRNPEEFLILLVRYSQENEKLFFGLLKILYYNQKLART